MKADRIRAQIDVDPETKIIALMITMLRPFGYGTVKTILDTVACRFGLQTTSR